MDTCVNNRPGISYVDLYNPIYLENLQSLQHLNDGHSIPIVGFATGMGDDGDTDVAIKYAIEVGYRYLDCAWFQGNEQAVGAAIQEAIKQGHISRENLFIATKLWNNHHAKKKVVPMIKESLSALKLNYVDLYLIQWPFGFNEKSGLWPDNEGPDAFSNVDYLETWEGMEDCVRLGLAKSIGVCNFNSEQLKRLLNVCKIRPVVNQVEVNPLINQAKLIKFCHDLEITVIGYHPFGKLTGVRNSGFPTSAMFDKQLIEIGRKYNKTAAQVILRYLIHQGICFVVKALEKRKILENISMFDFCLQESDIKYLESMNKNIRTECPIEFDKHPYYPFHIEF